MSFSKGVSSGCGAVFGVLIALILIPVILFGGFLTCAGLSRDPAFTTPPTTVPSTPLPVVVRKPPPPIEVGMGVAMLEPAPIKVGKRTVAEAKAGEAFVVLAVRDGWANVQKLVDGQMTAGWVKVDCLRHVKTVEEAAQANERAPK